MMERVINGGIFADDKLDADRAQAIIAARQAGGLPEPVVYYMMALEAKVLEAMFKWRRDALHEISWQTAKPKEKA